MTNKQLYFLAILLVSFFLGGCAMKSGPVPFATVDLDQKIKDGGYIQKTDNFLVLFDASSSMFDRPVSLAKILSDPNLHLFSGPTKFEVAKQTLARMNNTIPDLKLQGGIRVFGKDNALLYGLSAWDKSGMDETIAKSITATGGTTPMASAIQNSATDLMSSSGRIALIVMGDGLATDSAVLDQTSALQEKFGERLCIYTVHVGDDPAGSELMAKIAEHSGCGFTVNAAELTDSPQNMADFVTRVFLETGQKKAMAPQDSDGDGVYDDQDQCPDTPAGLMVDAKGCPLPIKDQVSIDLNVQFDFDKSTIRPEYNDQLTRVANFLKKYQDTKVMLAGHTCSIGTEQYNQGLSERRAASVKHYLVDKFGVAAARLTTRGFGETKPIASNDTRKGREANRRVMATITAKP